MFALTKPRAAATVAGLLVLSITGADSVDRTRITPAAQEVHLRNIRQLTFEGENAEAYFSFDGTKLIFQSTPRAGGCDQIYTMSLDGGDVEMLSTGQGRTTCSTCGCRGKSVFNQCVIFTGLIAAFNNRN